MDSGGTAKYTYNALNQRVRIDAGGAGAEYVFNPSGQRASAWNITGAQFQGQTYWGTAPVEFYASAVAHFQHQDWLGTERMRTTYNGGVEGTFSSLPFGDGYSVSGADDDGYHFAGMDQDSASNDHAQFRQYSNMAGSWMSPDPYRGSYDPTNPQSMNRYAYVMNNALAYTDPSGLYLAENCKGGCWGSGNPSGGLANEFTWMDIEQGIYANQSWTDPNSGITTNAPNIYKGPDGNWYAQEPDGSTTNLGSLLFNGSGSGSLSGSSSSTIGYFGNVSLGVPSAGGQNVIAAGAPNTGTIAPLSRAACASMVADSEYSIAAHTSGSSPDNPIVQALLGNSVSGLYNMWNAPSISSGLQQLVVGGYNPGIPGGIAIDGGLAGVYTNGAIKAAATNLGEAAGETAASVIGATKFAYDLGAWAYAYVARCR